METTRFLSQVVGPVLIVRGISIVFDRQHFYDMIDGLAKEVSTVAFSLFPIALMMTGITITLVHKDTSSLAAIVFHLIAWGAIIKSSLLILVPRAIVPKAQLLARYGFLNVVLLMCLALGTYLTWFGYFSAAAA